MFVLFFSKMLIRLTLVRNPCLNVMLFKNINYIIWGVYMHTYMRAVNVYIGHWPAIYFLMA
jgi:hypothetical protein